MRFAWLMIVALGWPLASVANAECEATGIGAEKVFAERVCTKAPEYGLHPEEVSSFGAGGIDVFLPAAEGRRLRADASTLRRAVRSLTDWAKANYTAFNLVEITIVAGDDRIAQGSKIGTGATKVTIY